MRASRRIRTRFTVEKRGQEGDRDDCRVSGRESFHVCPFSKSVRALSVQSASRRDLFRAQLEMKVTDRDLDVPPGRAVDLRGARQCLLRATIPSADRRKLHGLQPGIELGLFRVFITNSCDVGNTGEIVVGVRETPLSLVWSSRSERCRVTRVGHFLCPCGTCTRPRFVRETKAATSSTESSHAADRVHARFAENGSKADLPQRRRRAVRRARISPS